MGRFIVIEGLDGSGKTTQTAMLCEYLAKSGAVTALSFPNYGEKGCSLVEMYLGGELGKNPDDTNAYAASCFFACDRYTSYINKWKKDIDNPNATVVATRYTTSNAYHQLSKMPEELWDSFSDWIFDFEYNKLGLPKPDDVILLCADPSVSLKNVENRSAQTGQKKDIHELSPAYIKKTAKAAEYAAKKCGWKTVFCTPEGKMLSKEEIFDKIRLALDI